MEITDEIREYIKKKNKNRYSVRHNIKHDYYGVWRIEENEFHPDRNSIVYFDVPNELMDEIKKTIKNSKQIND